MQWGIKSKEKHWGCIQNKKGMKSFSEVGVPEVTQLRVYESGTQSNDAAKSETEVVIISNTL